MVYITIVQNIQKKKECIITFILVVEEYKTKLVVIHNLREIHLNINLPKLSISKELFGKDSVQRKLETFTTCLMINPNNNLFKKTKNVVISNSLEDLMHGLNYSVWVLNVLCKH